ncbi:Asp-tRNA(Asn)/Glu-tRNA(Gln) amidotransferase subunit GatB [Desulforhabdus amnigena]|jgi:aspartyl-tRNA(Asn)/glutamyl-tRNA(Gln) amidotransferase subunit B|uniref:Aspartyl/glutamyl-tRNA(Asn/Gln) amidotransferase subunit B n=1 Tax=Desulforhabdus amnigena TaxID=40218 RepID=A0A9W6FTK9_9BACT|nr:Asp-tRNA(Asn)/Glu-tRNA(Gln) amidotransferase subunit GatB [Desulforhabdus amnigena]NLJ28785.1 Asp-tRNA(Asn)/Glu-tRNA(Gln) amidotransferase subunit GatB [Deltaproteobacteria bacterium]GLI34175.1 aspartyl/glutamyl-tRNA(Asn/Gln) amidotransferase subunit B [Desulforhabdus amnigena]
MEFEPVIGLEIHAQLLTKSKIFCGCSTAFGASPNTHTCPVCLAMPGVLPVLNRDVVEFTIKMALATHCAIAPYSQFARKNYFYPDLPKGYQISQYELPLAVNGWVEIETEKGPKRIRIHRIHMEEDAGKLIHDEFQPISYVDLNRTGVPLIEIVSEPDIASSEEAAAYLKTIREILRYLEICDGNMEEGSFRCDANISLRPIGTQTLGVKTELKNMNSFRNVQRALDFEIRRQRALLERNEPVVQETRLWDAGRNVTQSMRSKEEAHDYRYFPDPDLVPVVVDENWVESVRAVLPELPDAKRERFIAEYNLPLYDAQVLTSSKALATYFETVVKAFPQPKAVSNWMMSELLKQLKRDDREIEVCPVPPENLAELLQLLDTGIISGKIAKTVFEEMYSSGKQAKTIVEEKGLTQMKDEGTIESTIDEVLAENPKEVELYRSGKEKLFGFFVGQVMRKTKGKANPQLVNDILRSKLGN